MIYPASKKYRPFPVLNMPSRQWPSQTLKQAPIWCSVDLRDGNQALAVPMNIDQKLELFETLVKVGFKEIEVGFPSASNTEFAVTRRLIEENRIPDDVSIQVLVQAREELIDKTVESLIGAKKAIIHMYNSTSPAQREYVFGLSKKEIIQVTRRGIQWIKDRVSRLVGTSVTLQYSPESFSATEVEFALEVCQAAMEVWQPTPEKRIILNLPDTVEVAMPNVYADQIEWFCTHLPKRDCVLISVHTHNDRGTGVAATELALLAGAERVEGTLFGNGERTGNLDIIIVALNLYMHGIDSGLDFSDLNKVREVYEHSTGMLVPARQPYGGELVFTAFSGSHQDAIKKGLTAWKKKGTGAAWDVPYLTIDPQDIGREYREIIRVNSQSGKGGVAYLLENECGLILPKWFQKGFGSRANDYIDKLGREVKAEELEEFLYNVHNTPHLCSYTLISFQTSSENGVTTCSSQLQVFKNGRETNVPLKGHGNGPIDAFVRAMNKAIDDKQLDLRHFEVTNFSEHSLGSGANSSAIAYIEIVFEGSRKPDLGAAKDPSIDQASIKAIICAINQAEHNMNTEAETHAAMLKSGL